MSVLRCGVLGSPIAHSLSPALHRAGYAEVGLDWEYAAHEVAEGGLAGFVAGRDESWRGLSLTMPLKREALPLAAHVSDVAARAGAANTLVRTDEGWSADNTDVPGMVAALRERWPAEVTGATVLGGGATAASAILALASLGCREVRLHVRNPGRAAQTLAAAQRLPADQRIDVQVGSLTDAATGDLVVSTVPVAAQSPDLLAGCAGVPVVFDVVYDPWPTPLAASTEGRVVVSGLDLLVHQAALQFEIFTGVPAPLDAMRAAGERALAERVERQA